MQFRLAERDLCCLSEAQQAHLASLRKRYEAGLLRLIAPQAKLPGQALEATAHVLATLLNQLPGLLKALREGLSSSAFDPFATAEFFSELESLHVQAFEQKAPEADAPLMVQVQEQIQLPTADEGPVDTDSAAVDDESLLQVDRLQVGGWVEFQEDEDNTLRCKLAAIIDATGKYIFVDRTGMKVRERSRESLALDVRRNTVRILDDTLLFDRALESVIDNLQRLNRGK